MPSADDDLRRLDKPIAQRILDKIKWLSQNFDELAHEKLAGELKEFYKLRIGSYRVIYTVDQEEYQLIIHALGHRCDIYRH